MMEERHRSGPKELPLVVFVCENNSARSVACEHIARARFGDDYAFSSAGFTQAYAKPKENVIAALRRHCAIDASDACCRLISSVLLSSSPALLITLCCEPDALCRRLDTPPSTTVVSMPLPGPKEVGDDDLFVKLVVATLEQQLPAFLASIATAPPNVKC